MSREETRAYNLVLDYIKNKIQQGELKLGNKLPSERTLMEELDLSRNSVREALRQLENMGFVKSNHGQGNFLVNKAGKGFSEIFSMLLLLQQTDRTEFMRLRSSIEIAAFKQAVLNPREEDLHRMQQALQAMEQAKDQNQMEKAETEFHRGLIAAGQNQLFSMIMDALSTLEDTYRRETLAHLDEKVEKLLLQSHRDVVEALQMCSIPNGREALVEHFALIE